MRQDIAFLSVMSVTFAVMTLLCLITNSAFSGASSSSKLAQEMLCNELHRSKTLLAGVRLTRPMSGAACGDVREARIRAANAQSIQRSFNLPLNVCPGCEADAPTALESHISMINSYQIKCNQ